jgi:hypothetical protein
MHVQSIRDSSTQTSKQEGDAKCVHGSRAAAPTTVNQVVGEFRNIKIASNPAGGAPVVSGQVGAVVGGQPFGISLSSANPLPEPVNKVDLTAVPYSGLPEVGRKLQQVGRPLVLGFGDPTGNYIGGGNGVIPVTDGALYTGGETLNLYAPGLKSFQAHNTIPCMIC